MFLEHRNATSRAFSSFRLQGKYCRMEKYGRTGQTLDSQMERVSLLTELRDVSGATLTAPGSPG